MGTSICQKTVNAIGYFTQHISNLIEMAKKIFIPITKDGNCYKLHVKDIRKVYSTHCPSRPPIPAFNSPKQTD